MYRIDYCVVLLRILFWALSHVSDQLRGCLLFNICCNFSRSTGIFYCLVYPIIRGYVDTYYAT
jgi:hypothetical protein